MQQTMLLKSEHLITVDSVKQKVNVYFIMEKKTVLFISKMHSATQSNADKDIQQQYFYFQTRGFDRGESCKYLRTK